MQTKSNYSKLNELHEKPAHDLIKLLKQNLYYDLVFCLTSFVGLALYLITVQYDIEWPHINDSRNEYHLKNVKPRADIKSILVWTKSYRMLAAGRKMFRKNNCSVDKCYVTLNRKYFRNNITRFDAIVFMGEDFNINNVPKVRSIHQKYIYFNMESAKNIPTCAPQYDGFFNWTATYRLDSDIPYPYIIIRDMNGTIVGPKRNMRWKKDMAAFSDGFANKIANKTKAAAWFVSNCRPVVRLKYVRELQYALSRYGLTVDVYGKCGNLKCPKKQKLKCNKMLERDYFFYLSMENSFDEDYVTEKLLRALHNNVVPIVFGGANYSRFLPPRSYINARRKSVAELAAIMHKIIKSPKLYLQYFRWKNYYTYQTPVRAENVCALCAAMHDKKRFEETTIHDKFRSWWNPNYKRICWRPKRVTQNTTTGR